eukprot:4353416-Amphidinium_carterae.1
MCFHGQVWGRTLPKRMAVRMATIAAKRFASMSSDKHQSRSQMEAEARSLKEEKPTPPLVVIPLSPCGPPTAPYA